MAEANKPANATGNKPANATGNKPANATGNKPANATGNKPANATSSNLNKLSNAELNKLLSETNALTNSKTTTNASANKPANGSNQKTNNTPKNNTPKNNTPKNNTPKNNTQPNNNNNNDNNDNNNNNSLMTKKNNEKPENKPSILEQGMESMGDVIGNIRNSITGNKTSTNNKEKAENSKSENTKAEMNKANENKKNNSRKNENTSSFIEDIMPEEGESMWYLVLKVVILVVVLIGLYYLGNYLLTRYLTASANTPMLLNTTKNGKQALVVSQDPTSINYIPIKKSENQEGIQFTYGFWFLIENFDYKKGEWKHVFHKGNSSSYPNRAPGVWFHPDKNAIRVYMNTVDNILEYVDIDNVPIRKWVYMNIILNNRNLDLYINGYLKVRKELSSLPKQNDDDLWVSMFGGFEGYLSNIRYYSYAIDFNEINSNIKSGPSTNNCIDTGEIPPYLDDNWWFSYNG
jgi:hypothetical protein